MKNLWQRLIDFLIQYNAKKVLNDIGQLLARNVLLLLFSFPVSVIIAAVLTREQIGDYQYVFSIFSSISFLNLPGLDYMITQQTARGSHGIVKQVFKIRSRMAILYVFTFLLFGGYFYFISQEYRLAYCFFAAAIPFPIGTVLSSLYQPYLLGHKAYALNARLNLFTGLISALTTILCAWFARDPVIIILISGMVMIVAHGIALWYAFHIYHPNDVPGASESILYGSRLSFINIMPTIGAQLDTLFVKGLFTSSDVAALGMASMPMDKSKAVYGVLLEYMNPQILAKSGKELFRKADRLIIMYTLYTLGLTSIVALATPPVFFIFFPNFVDVIPYAILATYSQVITAPAAIIESTLNSQHRLKQTGILRTALFICELTSSFLFIKYWGVMGAFLSRYLMGLLRDAILFYFYIQNRREAFAIQQ